MQDTRTRSGLRNADVRYPAGIIAYSVNDHVAVGQINVGLDNVFGILHPGPRLSGMSTQRRFHCILPGGSGRERVRLDADPVNVHSLGGPPGQGQVGVCAVRPYPSRVSLQVCQVELAVVSQDAERRTSRLELVPGHHMP
jgi:hypothetical protein